MDVCRFIKGDERLKHVPVIILSANPQIMSLAKEAGADAALAKPFTIKEIREVVAAYTS